MSKSRKSGQTRCALFRLICHQSKSCGRKRVYRSFYGIWSAENRFCRARMVWDFLSYFAHEQDKEK